MFHHGFHETFSGMVSADALHKWPDDPGGHSDLCKHLCDCGVRPDLL